MITNVQETIRSAETQGALTENTGKIFSGKTKTTPLFF
jgi:hypothetical protein